MYGKMRYGLLFGTGYRFRTCSKQDFIKNTKISTFRQHLCTENKIKIDYKFLCDPKNTEFIKQVICLKKSEANLDSVIDAYNKLQNHINTGNINNQEELEKNLESVSLLIPNVVSPHLLDLGDEPKILEYVNKKPSFEFVPKEFADIAHSLHLMIGGTFGFVAQAKAYTYYLQDTLAELEQALIKYTISNLLKKGFELISIPDMVKIDVVKKCGFQVNGDASTVFNVSNFNDVVMSGTGEMGISGYLQNKQFNLNELPLKLATVSRCFRSEKTNNKHSGKLYRVQEFTKVEMYGVTSSESGHESNELYNEFVEIQKQLFTPLGIHFQVLDMPLNDLGDPAYCKTDIEAWMPGKNIFGEISSASNCKNYQSQRLNITYQDGNGQEKLAHTLNGTACAVPRLLIAMGETHQTEDNIINIPEVLHPYMNKKKLTKSSQPCQIKTKKDINE